MGAFSQRITDASSSAQALSELLNIVAEEESAGANRTENQPRNGTVSEPGQSTATDVDDAFLNPMDIT